MLRRVIGVSLAMTMLVAALPAQAETICNMRGHCTVAGEGSDSVSGDNAGTDGSATPAKNANSGPRVCTFGGSPVECSTHYGNWIDAASAWCQKAAPPPPPDDPVWGGHADGAIYMCVRPSADGLPSAGVVEVWLPDGADAPAPPPNPEDLAWEAIATINLQPITLGTTPTPLEHNPNALGAVHMPIWLWADNPTKHQIGPIAATATERGYTVAIEATATNITFNLGNNTDPITCTTWKQPPPQARPDTPVICGSQTGYTTQGEHTITATTNWTINWQGIGQTGTIHHTTQTTATVRIGELHTLNSRVNG